MRHWALILAGVVALGGWSVDALATHEEVASSEAIERGEVREYFNTRELSQLGFSGRDAGSVKFLKELDFEFLAKGIASTVAFDRIPSVDEPRFNTIQQTNDWLADDELVLAVRFEGIARAYPLAILNWHEIVNDTFAGTDVIVTYCPLCDSGLAFVAPEIGGETSEFGTSGRLFRSDLVMYDRATGTFWEQFQGRAIVGPLVGEVGRMHRVPIDIVPYRFWKAENPEGEVLARPRVGDRLGNSTDHRAVDAEGFVRNYASDPYASYRQRNPTAGGATSFGTPFNDDRLQAKDRVVGLEVNGQAKAYARAALDDAQLVNDSVGGVPVLLVVGPDSGVSAFERTLPDTGTVLTFERTADGLLDDRGDPWSFKGVALEGPLQGTRLAPLTTTPSCWFAWVSFNPETELFGGRDAAE